MAPPGQHKILHARAHQISRRGKRQEEEPEVAGAPKLDEVAVQVSQEPQHKGRQGDAFVCDVQRTSVLGKSPKEARARIRAALEPGFYLHLPLSQKGGQDTAPAWQMLPLTRCGPPGEQFRGQRYTQEI